MSRKLLSLSMEQFNKQMWNVFKSFEYLNDKTIIEFGFCMI